jgi:hypothetical protein
MYVDQLRYFAFKNTTGEEIPPFGVTVIENAIIEDREIVFNVRKCTQEDEDLQEPAMLLFNNIQPVPDDSYGNGTRDFPTQALVDKTTLVSGDLVGPKYGSFLLSDTGSCFSIVAKDATDPHIDTGKAVYFVEAKHGITDFWIGKTPAITGGIAGRSGTTVSAGTVGLYWINSSGVLTQVGGSSTPKSIQAYNVGVDAILENSYVLVWRVRNRYVCIGVCN